MSTPEQRFALLGLTLPPAPKPLGVYRPSVQVQAQSSGGSALLIISGHGPLLADGSLMRGKVGAPGMSASDATDAARQTGLALLATLRATLGSLDQVGRVLKSLVMVNALPDFE